MKIRNGFVSNSSTSSFCIFGVELEYEDIIDCLKKNLPTEKLQEVLESIENSDSSNEFVYEYIKDSKLVCYSICSENYYIGQPWNAIQDNETGQQFKDSTKQLIEELFNKEMADKCVSIEQAWRDG